MSEKVVALLNQLTARPDQVVTGTVTSVDTDALTCEVEPDNEGAAHVQVRLRSVVDGGTDGFVLVPAVGSSVTLLLLDEHTSLVIHYSQVQVYRMATANDSLKAILGDWLAAIKQMVFTTNQGPTIQLVNTPQFEAIEQRLNRFFLS